MNLIEHQRFGWIDGQWDSIHKLDLPLSDRGLNHSDGIFETILILDHKPVLLKEHLNRWQKCATLLGMAQPPKMEWLEPLIEEGIQHQSLMTNSGIVRLNWSRGDHEQRGIDLPIGIPKAKEHRFWMEFNSYKPCFSPLSTMISCQERRNANSRISQCKTFAYSQSIQARREAKLSGYDEALLLSTNGELCCSSTANIIIRRNSDLLTPHLSSGCLPGVMRQQGIQKGVVHEVKLSAKPEPRDQWLLINSLSCRPITKVNNQNLPIWSNYQEFWYELISKKKH